MGFMMERDKSSLMMDNDMMEGLRKEKRLEKGDGNGLMDNCMMENYMKMISTGMGN